MYSKTPWKVAAAVAVAGLIAVGFSSGAKALELDGINLDAEVSYVIANHPDLYRDAAFPGDPIVRYAPMPDGVLGSTTLTGEPKIYINAVAPDALVKVIFVHEYVHWLQVKAGRYIPKVVKKGDACALMGAEFEAYQAGDNYAYLTGVEIPYTPNQPHPIFGYIKACSEASR